MGKEQRCRLTTSAGTFAGTAQLETAELRFRPAVGAPASAPRLRLQFEQISALDAIDGCLVVQAGGESLAFALGSRAPAWLNAIRNPPALLDKLGVTAGMPVMLAGSVQPELERLLAERGARLVDDTPDVILAGVEHAEALQHLSAWAERLSDTAALWLIYPKGRREVTEAQVLAAGRAAGLTDVKVASFSATHTALKFVIPRGRRERSPRSLAAPG